MQQVQKFTQAYSQAPWRKQVQMIGTFMMVLVFVWLIAALYLDVTARAATIGREIQVLQAGAIGESALSKSSDEPYQMSIDELRRHNADLLAQWAYLMSEAVMEKRAQEMGFQPMQPGQALFAEVVGYTAPQTAVLAPPPGPTVAGAAESAPVITKSLIDWFKDQIRQAGELLK